MPGLRRLAFAGLVGVVCATIAMAIVAQVLPGLPAFWIGFGFSFITVAVATILLAIQAVGQIEKAQEDLDD